MPENLVMKEIRLNDVESNPWQPRKTKPTVEEFAELMESIRARGQLTPVRARPKGSRFQLVDGELRVAALRKLGKKTVLAVVAEMVDADMRAAAFAQNVFIQMTMEDKEKYVGMVWETDFKPEGKTVAEMAKAVGIGPATLGRFINAFGARRIAMKLASTKKEKDYVRDVSSREMAECLELLQKEPKAARILVKSFSLTGENAREILESAQPARMETTKMLMDAEKSVRRENVRRESQLRKAAVLASQAREQRERKSRQTVEENWRDEQAEEERQALETRRREEMTRERVAREVAAEVQRIVANHANAMASLEELDYNYLRPAIQIDEFAKLIGDQLKSAIEQLNAGPALAKKVKETHEWAWVRRS